MNKVLFIFRRLFRVGGSKIQSLIQFITIELINGAKDFIYFRYFLGGIKKNHHLIKMGATATQSTDYHALASVFKEVEIKQSDVLVDVGCGKGRVILWWIKNNIKNLIIGVELDSDIAESTSKNLSKYNNVKILNQNIINNVPEIGTIYYLYNPFDYNVLEKFKREVFLKSGDRLIIVYYNCQHIHIFENDDRWTVFRKKISVARLGADVNWALIIKNKSSLS